MSQRAGRDEDTELAMEVFKIGVEELHRKFKRSCNVALMEAKAKQGKGVEIYRGRGCNSRTAVAT